MPRLVVIGKTNKGEKGGGNVPLPSTYKITKYPSLNMVKQERATKSGLILCSFTKMLCMLQLEPNGTNFVIWGVFDWDQFRFW